MQLIRCTQKLIKELRIEPSEKEAQPGYIGGWHANLLRIDRRKCILFTNDRTLYSFFVPGLNRLGFERFRDVFRENLFISLTSDGFSQTQIEKVLSEYQTIGIAKTNNRSVLGSMNDLAFQIKYRVAAFGGLENTDFITVNRELNHTPRGAIQYMYSIELLRSLL
ncbi:MAG: hypothetical protein ABIJ12_01675 [bacterium]